MKPERMARRLQPYRPEHPWCCACCRERTQLQMAATIHPLPDVGVAASVMFNAMTAINEGMYGGISVENLFD